MQNSPNLSHSLINTQSHHSPIPTHPSNSHVIKILPTNSNDILNKSQTLSTVITPKYLTAINKHKIPSNEQGKAMSLALYLLRCQSIHIKIFHISWFTLFVSFFCYFGLYYLTLNIEKDLNLNSTHISFAFCIRSFATAISCIIFGDLCDKIGARYSYLLLLLISLFPIILIIFVSYYSYSIVSFMILSFFIGIIGASFVITQYHVTQFFSSTCVGIANGLSAGWGFCMATFTASFFMVPLPLPQSQSLNNMNNVNNATRLIILIPLIPLLLLFIMIIFYYINTIDSPNGNISKENISKRLILFPKYKWRRITSDYRIWILSLSYAVCFGIEMTVINYFVDYILFQFKQSGFKLFHTSALPCSLIYLFARGFGGYLSDLLYLKYGIQGRIYCLFCALLFESTFLFLFSMASFHFGFTMLMLTFFILYVQIAQGIVFAIVPNLPHQMYIGLCMGIVAFGGNIGSCIASILFINVPSNITYKNAWIICSIFVFICSIAILFVKFTKQEIQNDLKNKTNDFWTCITTNHITHTNTVGFIIH